MQQPSNKETKLFDNTKQPSAHSAESSIHRDATAGQRRKAIPSL